MPFRTENGIVVPAVTVDQMREVDRIAVEEFGLGILQMMENAGRNLAGNVLDMLGGARGEVTIPPDVYHRLGLAFEPLFGKRYWIRLEGGAY